MNQSQSPDPRRSPSSPFRPTVSGCVGRDPALARAAEECYPLLLSSSVAYTYRSLLAEREDPLLADRLDDFAAEDAEHFRMLGRLILALGGDPSLRTRITLGGTFARKQLPLSSLLGDALREEKATVDRLETLLGKCRDRVARSLLAYVLADHGRRQSFLEEEYASRQRK